jgi:LA2681-like HEPN
MTLDEITEMLDSGDFSSALLRARELLSGTFEASDKRSLFLRAEIAGFLITIGAEGKLKEPVEEGLNILESEREYLAPLLHPASYEYNLGNARLALFELNANLPSFSPSLESFDQLSLAKNHYWKAYRLLTEGCEALRNQLLVNLGTSLNFANRVVEAIHLCHRVLEEAPDFGMARNKLALSLLALSKISGGYSQKLVYTIAEQFQISAECIDFPPLAREYARNEASHFYSHPAIRGMTADDVIEESRAAALESQRHSAYRRFCLDTGLALCEHALYCNCAGARHDDLRIATASQPLSADFVPRSELVLNRLKAEFGWARLQYYQSVCSESDWNLHEAEIVYTELFEGEDTTVRSELLRSSFRQCFGILDKIAAALCDVLELAGPEENIYFESFWKPRSTRGSGATRWEKLVGLPYNAGLTALYSSATDLNQVNGEWRDFKLWRNALEHRSLLLVTDQTAQTDPFHVLGGDKKPLLVAYSEFQERTLHLLQMTCSAVFSLVFCLRQHATEQGSDEDRIRVTLEHKHRPDIWDRA